MSRLRTVLVVPCFQEAARLPVEAFAKFHEARPEVGFLFVDDGSTDGTRAVIEHLKGRAPEAFRLLVRERNGGKAAAVRDGVLALGSLAGPGAREPEYIGYWDADLATPLAELEVLEEALDRDPRCEIAMGARVALLGRSISRSSLRHYAGRAFATAISLCLDLPVYDTQCGAKLFRRGGAVEAAFAEPFAANWTFDVELLARRLQERRARTLPDNDGWVREVPLRSWHDVPGSKVRPRDFLIGLVELARIRARYGPRPTAG